LNLFKEKYQSNKLATRVINWIRANVQRMTVSGRVILSLSRPFVSGKLCTHEDVEYLRKKMAEQDKTIIDAFIPEDEQVYFNF
jgi:hypothetical protein